MAKLGLDAEEAGAAQLSLIKEVTVDDGRDIEAAEVPDDVEDVVDNVAHKTVVSND